MPAEYNWMAEAKEPNMYKRGSRGGLPPDDVQMGPLPTSTALLVSPGSSCCQTTDLGSGWSVFSRLGIVDGKA